VSGAAALAVIQRCFKVYLRKWLARIRAALDSVHSFEAVNEVIDACRVKPFVWLGEETNLAKMRQNIRRTEAARIQRAWRAHRNRRLFRLERWAARQLQSGVRLMLQRKKRKKQQARRSRGQSRAQRTSRAAKEAAKDRADDLTRKVMGRWHGGAMKM